MGDRRREEAGSTLDTTIPMTEYGVEIRRAGTSPFPNIFMPSCLNASASTENIYFLNERQLEFQ